MSAGAVLARREPPCAYGVCGDGWPWLVPVEVLGWAPVPHWGPVGAPWGLRSGKLGRSEEA